MMKTESPPPKGGGFPRSSASRKPSVSYPTAKAVGFKRRLPKIRKMKFIQKT
ncbi:MAG: hypothetical protein HYW25_01785 [Candidatus Aenigmarchaeota archaeon]|nr:hypothetical protein [Candidatus Aenigmarchaeota archaeon]